MKYYVSAPVDSEIQPDSYNPLEHEDSAIIYAKSLDLMVRNFSLSVSIWLLVLASLLLANINLVIFIFVIPGLFGKILKQLLVKKQNLIKI